MLAEDARGQLSLDNLSPWSKRGFPASKGEETHGEEALGREGRPGDSPQEPGQYQRFVRMVTHPVGVNTLLHVDDSCLVARMPLASPGLLRSRSSMGILLSQSIARQ